MSSPHSTPNTNDQTDQPSTKVEKIVVVNAIPRDLDQPRGPQPSKPHKTTHSHHDHGDSCCGHDGEHHASDVSDDEKDTEPGLIDPVNEYDPEIDFIDLTNDRLQDIGDISKCTKLEQILLRQNKLDNTIFEKLCDCKNLQQIDLYENRLTPIPRGETVLNGLDKLEELDLSFNELRFTRGLPRLPSLTKLYFIQNKLTNIHPDINNISDKIEMLELGSNRLRVVENLGPCFASLKQLFLGRNKIAQIDPDSFKYLTNLTLLSLQSNRIRTLSNLAPFAHSLEEIYMSHNGLTSMSSIPTSTQQLNTSNQAAPPTTMSDASSVNEEEKREKREEEEEQQQRTGLELCTNLRVLDLSNNFLTVAGIDTDVLKTMTNLEELWLNDNRIENLDWLYSLQRHQSLRTLYLERNPCCGDTSVANPRGRAAYVTKVKQILPQLEQIDAEYL